MKRACRFAGNRGTIVDRDTAIVATDLGSTTLLITHTQRATQVFAVLAGCALCVVDTRFFADAQRYYAAEGIGAVGIANTSRRRRHTFRWGTAAGKSGITVGAALAKIGDAAPFETSSGHTITVLRTLCVVAIGVYACGIRRTFRRACARLSCAHVVQTRKFITACALDDGGARVAYLGRRGCIFTTPKRPECEDE